MLTFSPVQCLMSVFISSVQLLSHCDFSRNRSRWYFHLVVSWWSLFTCQSSQSGFYFHSCDISQQLTGQVWRQSSSLWQKKKHFSYCFMSKPGTDPTWNWLTCQTEDVSHKFCFGLALLQRLKSSFAHQFPPSSSCCFRTSARTSRTMWSRFTPSWRPSSPWSSCPTPSTLSWTSGWSYSSTTKCKVAWEM